jgi:hypothetical protein
MSCSKNDGRAAVGEVTDVPAATGLSHRGSSEWPAAMEPGSKVLVKPEYPAGGN